MSLFIFFASFFLFGCQQQVETINELDYQHSSPNVVISRSAFDYPEDFTALYLKADCKHVPEVIEKYESH